MYFIDILYVSDGLCLLPENEKCCKLMPVMGIHTSLPLDDLYITSTLPLEIE